MKTKTAFPIFFPQSLSSALTLTMGLAFAVPSRADNTGIPVIVPGIREGDTVLTIPFTGSSNSVRFQQVYDSAAFTFYGQRPYLIHELQFRTDDELGRGFLSRFPTFQINLSTTTRSVDGLSANFAENLGFDDTAVLPFGAYQVSADYFSDITPQLFSMFITFPTPFYYDPSRGNLLLDIRNFGGGSTSWGVPPFFGPAYVDAVNVAGDSVSSVFANDVTALSGQASTRGLVTLIMATPVPEPSTVTLLAIGLGVMALGWRRTRKV